MKSFGNLRMLPLCFYVPPSSMDDDQDSSQPEVDKFIHYILESMWEDTESTEESSTSTAAAAAAEQFSTRTRSLNTNLMFGLTAILGIDPDPSFLAACRVAARQILFHPIRFYRPWFNNSCEPNPEKLLYFILQGADIGRLESSLIDSDDDESMESDDASIYGDE